MVSLRISACFKWKETSNNHHSSFNHFWNDCLELGVLPYVFYLADFFYDIVFQISTGKLYFNLHDEAILLLQLSVSGSASALNDKKRTKIAILLSVISGMVILTALFCYIKKKIWKRGKRFHITYQIIITIFQMHFYSETKVSK